MSGITSEQYDILMKPLKASRVATRSLGGKQLSYLEAWDVRAHLIRLFGFGNFDAETVEVEYLGANEYQNKDNKAMVEVIWRVTFRLTINEPGGREIAVYSESAVGSATGGREGAGIGDLHDNAIKSATSDALKRCAINLGTQFGLSLYQDGTHNDVIKSTVVKPEGYVSESEELTPEQIAALGTLGATEVEEASA